MAREKLGDRRPSETFEVTTSSGEGYTVTASRYPDGRVAEVFINSPKKAGNAADVNARDAAIVCSIALQHGTPLEVIAASLSRDANGRASGALGEALNVLLARVEAPS